jgi:secreted trypsin-like serine protease
MCCSTARIVHFGGLILALTFNSAGAVVGGVGIDPNTPQSPWAGVGVVESGPGHFSGALIGPRHVLTAAHVVGGRPAAEVRFRLNLAQDNSPLLQAKSVHVFPGYKGTGKGPDGFWHKDLAIVELAEPAPAGVPIYPLSKRLRPIKSMVTFVGYGRGGDGVKGAALDSNPQIKRIGSNRIDVLLADRRDQRSSQPDLFLFDFDGPDFTTNPIKPDTPFNASLSEKLEATFAGGDSGAPVFMFESGQWRIVGIAAFVAGQESARFGAVAGATLVPAFVDWIVEVTGGDARSP